MTTAPPEADFTRRTEPYRRELLAHCYRMLGSVHDAEDLVQETYLRAWRAYGRFEGRSSLRTWLYQIATNTCLTALRHGSRRQLPSGLGAPGEGVGPVAAEGHAGWLEPLPDAMVTAESDGPEAVAVSREHLRLALIAGLQYLPPRQRAVLLLREVLAFPAAEVAEMLGTTVVAVKSGLQRARARIEAVAPAADRIVEPDEPQVRALLARYVEAFVTADAAALQQLLRADATLELPPSAVWYSGEDAAAQAMAGLGSPGDWRMVPAGANGQPAAAVYLRDGGVHRAFGVVVLTAGPADDGAGAAIARITVFADPGLPAVFGLPPVYEGAPGHREAPGYGEAPAGAGVGAHAGR
ncbi:sigma-70 family RNA polymerase sigma factor [Streptomyces sp. NPDC049040]|uniref:sigma-70 family RNA polymerase sigma factor n=1 Tax=Streptomyces sp. NPDC049040 TaxID=3365593 RepID=UPI00371F9D24